MQAKHSKFANLTHITGPETGGSAAKPPTPVTGPSELVTLYVLRHLTCKSRVVVQMEGVTE